MHSSRRDITTRGGTVRQPRFLLAFPTMQFGGSELIRPDGSLALPYLDAALTAAGFESRILDMSIGTDADSLDDTFYNPQPLANGMVRVGMSPERILQEVADADVVGLTSTFTQQTSRCLEVVSLIREAYPDKILVAGGVNARALKDVFLAHGVDVIVLSEGEQAIVQLAHFLHAGSPALSAISAIAFRSAGRTVITAPAPLNLNLDDYPMPAWHKLPNERHWEISRIWGGKQGWMDGEARPRYASMITSRGCPFRCTYCHISLERGGEAGDIGSLRVHSLERVQRELDTLAAMDVRYLFINDDSFLAKRQRVLAILDSLRRYHFTLADITGVNIVHLFRRHRGRLIVDEDLLHAMYEAGFRKLSLPFESGSQRLIDDYSTRKWRLGDCDVEDLVGKMKRAGIAADGNFMIGYPDETQEELTDTFLLARRMMDAGLVGCQFFMVQPFPGSQLFDESLRNGQLPTDWHWDELGWSKGSPFLKPKIDKNVLRFSWSLVWKLLNPMARTNEFSAQISDTSVSISAAAAAARSESPTNRVARQATVA